MKLGMEVGLGPGHIVLDRDPAPPPQRTQPPIFDPCLLSPNGWIDHDETWCGGRPQPGHIALDGDPALPSLKGQTGQSPQFSNNVYCGQTADWIKMPLGTEIGLSPGDIVLDGDPSSLPLTKGDTSPQFFAHLCCGQTPGLIKMPLGT